MSVRLRMLVAVLGIGALVLTGCGGAPTGGSGGTSTGTGEAFEPVTITHAFGQTKITERPQRVATWGWGSTDAAIALGAIPVAIPKNSYGADKEGYMPWTKEALVAADAKMPKQLTEGEVPPFEEIAAVAPDLILANYSGITKSDYDKLSQIAPTVAYPDQPWATPWRDVITTVGQALGKADEAKQLLADIDAAVAKAAADNPEFKGKTIAAVAVDPAAFYVYRGADPRVQFLEDLGFELASSVSELDTAETTFYYTLSLEEVDKLTSDVLLSYSPSEARAAEVLADPALQGMQQFQAGTVASVAGEAIVSSVSPPTALSLTWGLNDFVEALSAAAAKVDAGS